MTEVKIVDNGVEKTFVIKKMTCTACDSFCALVAKTLLKDEVKLPADLSPANLRQAFNDVMQNGRKDEEATDKDSNKTINKLLENMLGVLRGAISHLNEADRILLLDKLLNNAEYKNGIVSFKLTYHECDQFIDNFMTIYKLAWEIIKVNFPLLSAVTK